MTARFMTVDTGGVSTSRTVEVIEACRLTFRTYGRLAPDLSNIVLMPTWLNGNAEGLATYNYLGPDGIVDTDDYFVIAVNALGNGYLLVSL